MSSHTGFDKTLYASAALSVLLALAAVGWSLAYHRPPPQYQAGDRFDEVPGLGLSEAPTTLVLWVSTRCKPCRDSAPFYRRLTERSHRTRVIVMGQEPAEVLADYMSREGVRPSRVVSVGARALKFRGTPTVVLIGADSIVRSVWYGKRRTSNEEEEIVKILN